MNHFQKTKINLLMLSLQVCGAQNLGYLTVFTLRNLDYLNYLYCEGITFMISKIKHKGMLRL